MTPQVLAFTERKEVEEVLESEIKDITGFKPVVKSNFEDFKLLLDILVKVDLVIIDSTRKDIENYKIIELLKDHLDLIKEVIVLSDEKFQFSKTQVFKFEEFEYMMSHVGVVLAKFQQEVHEYISMPIELLVHFKILPFDLFIKISKEKFVKRIPACEEIDRKVIEALKAKGVYELYLDKKYNKEFSQLLLNNMINDLEKEYNCTSEKLEIKDDVFHTTKEIVQSLGLAPRVISLCESVMGCIIQDILKSKNSFSSYLNHLQNAPQSFHYRYIELTSYIATQIVDDFQIFASSDFSKRVVFAAFFCDVTLKRPEWIHIRREEQLLGLSGSCIKEINMHALKASEMVLNYQNAPIGAHRIIRQHHGALNGLGFSDTHLDKLCPLTKCLISSQEMAYEILSQPQTDAREVIGRLMNKYRGTPLQEMFDRFESKCRPHLASTKTA